MNHYKKNKTKAHEINCRKKEKENIIEYVLYMYRMEDLLRAYQFEMEEINAYVLGHEKIGAKDKEETKAWLSDMANQMLEEGVQEKGHLQQTQELVGELAKIHWQLLKEEPEYIAINRKTQTHLLQMISDTKENFPEHEIQVFINTLYGILLSKLNGKKIPIEIMDAATSFGDALACINHAYMSNYLGQKA
ncbi:DUF4924 family protein [Cyclobacterium qasimii]|uniref:DUF4924 domain-containing protein n=1 Tax=Cyclobacterium qasimii M12-11B TaxID=641524 RepID=S7X4G0_9BACT|nr:DUF4924 family protein [Cyclobacterium qasimii]EPR70988.1 hypothetical protein ADICYQ_0716 [Cyclobacterium qasimii M12-11B]